MSETAAPRRNYSVEWVTQSRRERLVGGVHPSGERATANHLTADAEQVRLATDRYRYLSVDHASSTRELPAKARLARRLSALDEAVRGLDNLTPTSTMSSWPIRSQLTSVPSIDHVRVLVEQGGEVRQFHAAAGGALDDVARAAKALARVVR